MKWARGVAIAAGLGCVLALFALVLPRGLLPTAAAVITPTADGLTLATAIAGPGADVMGAGLTQSALPDPPPTDAPLPEVPNAVSDSSLTYFPTDGETLTILTTGDAGAADDPNFNPSEAPTPPDGGDDQSLDLQRGNLRGNTDVDVSVLRVDLDVPATANCLSFDFQFLSEEFPDFVAAEFNDAFIAELDNSTWDTEGSAITAPDNFAFAQGGDVVSVNAIGIGGFSADEAAGTTYDGATPLLSAATPITPGVHSLFLSIFDQGDHLLDSAAFVDNLRVGYVVDPGAQCVPGAKVKQFDLDLTPTTHVGFVGDDHTVTAHLEDLNADPTNVEGGTVLFEVTGANPSTQSVDTQESGDAELTYLGEVAGTDTITACHDADDSGACGSDEQFASVTVTWETVLRPRLAFTDDRDEIVEVEVHRTLVPVDNELPRERFFGADRDRLGIGSARHTGEASPVDASEDSGAVFVSSVEDPHGEVYASFANADGFLGFGAGDRIRVTCDNSAVESHPVYGDGWIAWASDIDGDWEIYVGRLLGEPDPGAAEAGGSCDTVEAHQLTDNEDADDLWPAWAPDGQGLYFSSSYIGEDPGEGDDPLGDIYRMDVDDGEVIPGSLLQQTDSDAADTQPAVTMYKQEEWLAFTSTRFLGEGSVVFARARLDDEDVIPEGFTAWGGGEFVQSSEPAWGGESNDPDLAYTSTRNDPYGDVWVADIVAAGTGTTPRIADHGAGFDVNGDPVDGYPVADRPGVAESHPTWRDSFFDDISVDRVAPAWAMTGPAAAAAAAPHDTGALFVTVRALDADISDVLAEDGSQRRRIVPLDNPEGTPDEAGPDYSPDGTSVAFSRGVVDDELQPCTRSYFANDLPIAIPSPTGSFPASAIESSIQVPDDLVISDVDVQVGITHPAIGELLISFGRGDDTAVLSENNGGDSNDFSGTIFDDEADQSVTDIPGDNSESPHSGRYRPEQTLTEFDERNARDTWRLIVQDGNLQNDGQLNSWSITIEFEDCAGAGREIMTAEADGADVADLVSLADLTGRVDGDVDTDPAWSPDGTRIAFVRQRWNEQFERYGPANVWVATLAGDPAYRVLPPEFEFDTSTTEEDPSWSPDGRHLVVTAAHETPPGLTAKTAVYTPKASAPVLQARRAEAPGVGPTADTLWVVDASGSGRRAELTFSYDFEGPVTVPVSGRSPAWSPDGASIAYDLTGGLRLVTVNPAGPTDEEYAADAWPVSDPRAVTGFQDQDENHPLNQGGDPTDTRAQISVAEDPDWRADGQEIAFAGQPPGQPDQRGIWAITPEGTGLRMLTPLHPDQQPTLDQDARGPETEPTWAPVPRADLAVTVAITGSPAAAGAPFTATYVVRNNGPSLAQGVVLTTSVPPGGSRVAVAPPAGCLADGSSCTFPELAAGASRTYEVQLSYPVALAGTASGAVTSLTDDPVPGNNTASADFAVLPAPADVAVTVTLDEPIGYVGGQRTATVTVRNIGPGPAEDVTLRTAYPATVTPAATETCLVDGTDCAIGDLAPDATKSFTVDLTAIQAGTGKVRARVASTTPDPVASNNVAQRTLEIKQPKIRLLPSVARPGQVVLAFGEDMPPGTEVTVDWEPGITVDDGPFLVGADGTMRASLLLVRRDRLGDRTLTVTSETDEFTAVTGEMLVVLRMMTPPDFVGRG